jgi:hypothetical protein
MEPLQEKPFRDFEVRSLIFESAFEKINLSKSMINNSRSLIEKAKENIAKIYMDNSG